MESEAQGPGQQAPVPAMCSRNLQGSQLHWPQSAAEQRKRKPNPAARNNGARWGTRFRLLAFALLLAIAHAEEPCPLQRLVRARPSDLGVTHATMLGQISNNETYGMDNVIIHAFVKIAKMVSGNTHLYGIGWVEGLEAGIEIEFMPEHLPWLDGLPPLEVWAIDSFGDDLAGPYPVTVTHGTIQDTQRMGFRMECIFQSRFNLFQLRVAGWIRSYALHARNIAQPGTLLPWYQFTSPPTTLPQDQNPNQQATGGQGSSSFQAQQQAQGFGGGSHAQGGEGGQGYLQGAASGAEYLQGGSSQADQVSGAAATPADHPGGGFGLLPGQQDGGSGGVFAEQQQHSLSSSQATTTTTTASLQMQTSSFPSSSSASTSSSSSWFDVLRHAVRARHGDRSSSVGAGELNQATRGNRRQLRASSALNPGHSLGHPGHSLGHRHSLGHAGHSLGHARHSLGHLGHSLGHQQSLGPHHSHSAGGDRRRLRGALDNLGSEPGSDLGHHANALDQQQVREARELQGSQAVGGPNHVPLVVVMTLAFSPDAGRAANEHYAQQLVRHAEYHLDQLAMQRVIVYIHEALFLTPAFHGYVARHLPAHLVPYVTFVVWNEFFMIKNPWYDQYVKYFHGVVALWGHGGALAALIDIDEYIAFPAPQTTLHQALARCNATHLDWVRLTNQMIICDTCHKRYNRLWKQSPLGGGDIDLQMWNDARDPAAHDNGESTLHDNTAYHGSHAAGSGGSGGGSSGSGSGAAGNHSCRWWKEDPLKRYTRLWNDRWFTSLGGVAPQQLGTLEAYTQFQGKHLIRGEAAVAFMHHRGELLPGRYEAWLDPGTCPYIAHLVHSNGFRPKRWGGKLEYFVRPERAVNWFLLQDTARADSQLV